MDREDDTERPIIDFDHHSSHYREQSLAIYTDLRSHCPVGYSERYGGFWVITRYEDVAEVAKDDLTFASRFDEENGLGGVTIPPFPGIRPIPIETDPPDFQKYRQILTPYFTKGAAEVTRPELEEWTTEALDAVIDRGSLDVVTEFGHMVTGMHTMRLLGLPIEDWIQYARPAHLGFYVQPGSPLFDEMVAGFAWIDETFRAVITDRRRHPRHDADFFTEMTRAHFDDRLLTDDEIAAIGFGVLGAGFDTTASLTAHALLYLSENPESCQQLIANPALVKSACEEFLRHFTPAQGIARTVVEEHQIGGQRLRPGDRVFISWASANHDDAVFPDPDRVVLDRQPNRHFGFGFGAHKCLGQHQARVQFEVLLTQFLARLPDYHIDRNQCERYPSIVNSNGWISMPATFSRGG